MATLFLTSAAVPVQCRHKKKLREKNQRKSRVCFAAKHMLVAMQQSKNIDAENDEQAMALANKLFRFTF